jgi:hypothetical protein
VDKILEGAIRRSADERRVDDPPQSGVHMMNPKRRKPGSSLHVMGRAQIEVLIADPMQLEGFQKLN